MQQTQQKRVSICLKRASMLGTPTDVVKHTSEMFVKKISAFAIFWQFFQLSSCSLAHVKYANLKAINWGLPLAGHRLNATPIATSKVPNRMKCMAQCGKTEGCVAINLGPNRAGEHECELLDSTRYRVLFAIIIKAGWTYTGPKTKCDTNPCRSKFPCIARENDHICLDLSKVATCQGYRDSDLTKSGIYTLTQPTGQQFKAYCDLEDEDGGWIIFVRNDGQDTEIFNQDWATYQNGFGDLNSNFWWGNEFLHLVTKDAPHELKVDLVKSSATGYVKYTGFQIADKGDGYRLSFNVDSYTGDGGTSLKRHNGTRFSTPDKDLDTSPTNCAKERNVGWWFVYCAYVIPTRLSWGNWKPDFIQLKIRPTKV